jgi:hypothetical protein
MAEDAISSILQGVPPHGVPLEGALQHLTKLVEFGQSEQAQILSEAEREIFAGYLEEVAERARVEQQTLAQAQAAEGFGAAGPAGANGQPNADVLQQQPSVGQNELMDESLPTA